MTARESRAAMPLAVRLDDTLIHSHFAWEMVAQVLKGQLFQSLALLYSMLFDRAAFLRKIDSRIVFAPSALPWNTRLREFLHTQHQKGRTLILIANLPASMAAQLLAHLPGFSKVMTKAQFSAQHGAQPFEYIGNDPMVGATVITHEAPARNTAGALLTSLRPRQWLKNLLVFVPMFAGHAIDASTLLQSLTAFAAFSLCASSAYLLNDVLDASDDRQHPSKHRRPIAAGALPIPLALIVSALLAAVALGLSAAADQLLLLVVLAYFVCTVFYSTYLKRLLMVDIVVLAILYSFRIVGGSAITRIEPSFWLLTFSFFLFLSLALLKRYSELANLLKQGKEKTAGRGYRTRDKLPIGVMGINSGFTAVLILILYFNSSTVLTLYPHPAFLFGIVPLIVFWIGRLWTLAYRGEVNEDPLLYVSRDKVSLVVIAMCFVLCYIAAS